MTEELGSSPPKPIVEPVSSALQTARNSEWDNLPSHEKELWTFFLKPIPGGPQGGGVYQVDEQDRPLRKLTDQEAREMYPRWLALTRTFGTPPNFPPLTVLLPPRDASVDGNGSRRDAVPGDAARQDTELDTQFRADYPIVLPDGRTRSKRVSNGYEIAWIARDKRTHTLKIMPYRKIIPESGEYTTGGKNPVTYKVTDSVWQPVSRPQVQPPASTDEASRRSVDDFERRLRDATAVIADRDARIAALDRQVQELTAQLSAALVRVPPVPPRPVPPPAPILTRAARWREGQDADPNATDVPERMRAQERAHRILERRRRLRESGIGRLLAPVRQPTTPEGQAALRSQREGEELTMAQNLYKEAQEARKNWPLWRKVSMGLALTSLGILGTATGFTTAVAATLGLSKWMLGASVSIGAGAAVGGLTWRQLKKQNHPRAGLIGALAGITTTALSWFGGRWLADTLAPGATPIPRGSGTVGGRTMFA